MASLNDDVDYLTDHDAVEAAWVFGSVDRGTARPNSDLDVAVLGPKPLSASEKRR